MFNKIWEVVSSKLREQDGTLVKLQHYQHSVSIDEVAASTFDITGINITVNKVQSISYTTNKGGDTFGGVAVAGLLVDVYADHITVWNSGIAWNEGDIVHVVLVVSV